ncbi:MAG: phosphodiesterase [Clostridia bacterium]|nr:phosphodiesterase [Clostridia bacterium]
MKIMVASDIHGSYEHCKMIIDKYHELNCDKLLLLGDLLYHGPRNNLPKDYNPKAVIELLNSEADNILAVRGNCDTEVDQMVLDFPIMAEYIYLISDDTVIFATHGHKINPDCPPRLPKNAILLNGHTHVAKDIMMDGYRYMNPGSPSIPKENSAPSYIIVENGKAELMKFN